MKTVSLELAKKLKESGYDYITAFYYIWSFGHQQHYLLPIEAFNTFKEEDYAAPTADELLDSLPEELSIQEEKDRQEYGLEITKFKTTNPDYTNKIFYRVAYVCPEELIGYEDNNLAEAAGYLRLYLKANKLL